MMKDETIATAAVNGRVVIWYRNATGAYVVRPGNVETIDYARASRVFLEQVKEMVER
jgi:hypothetical protein